VFSCVIITPVPNSWNEVPSNFWKLLLILLSQSILMILRNFFKFTEEESDILKHYAFLADGMQTSNVTKCI